MIKLDRVGSLPRYPGKRKVFGVTGFPMISSLIATFVPPPKAETSKDIAWHAERAIAIGEYVPGWKELRIGSSFLQPPKASLLSREAVRAFLTAEVRKFGTIRLGIVQTLHLHRLSHTARAFRPGDETVQRWSAFSELNNGRRRHGRRPGRWRGRRRRGRRRRGNLTGWALVAGRTGRADGWW